MVEIIMAYWFTNYHIHTIACIFILVKFTTIDYDIKTDKHFNNANKCKLSNKDSLNNLKIKNKLNELKSFPIPTQALSRSLFIGTLLVVHCIIDCCLLICCTVQVAYIKFLSLISLNHHKAVK